jgi:hypothetical protein
MQEMKRDNFELKSYTMKPGLPGFFCSQKTTTYSRIVFGYRLYSKSQKRNEGDSALQAGNGLIQAMGCP